MLNLFVQVKENKGYKLVESDFQINDSISESKVHPSDIADSSAIVSIVQKYPQYIMSYPMQKKVEKVVEVDLPKLLSSVNSSLQNKDEISALVSSAEMINYVDEIEECRFSLPKDGACQDEMLLKFNSSGLSRRTKTQFGCDESHIDQDEPTSETLSTRNSRKNKRAPSKRSRRRSTSIETQGIVDIGYMIYYQKPCKSPSISAHHSRKDKKNRTLQSFSEKEKSVQSCETKDSNRPGLFLAEEASHSQHSEQKFEPRLKEVSKFSVQPCLEQEFVGNQIRSEDSTRRKKYNQNIRGCSLNQPCYFCIYDEKDFLETQFMNPKRVIEATHFEQDYMHDETKEKNIATSNVSNPRTNGSLTRIETEVPYLRAMTMPQERHRKGKDKMLRTFSCPYQHLNHVHPKLPDYDDIAAKFSALKREHLQNKDYSRK
jgi:vacuolar protein sorting-associated protein IST1